MRRKKKKMLNRILGIILCMSMILNTSVLYAAEAVLNPAAEHLETERIQTEEEPGQEDREITEPETIVPETKEPEEQKTEITEPGTTPPEETKPETTEPEEETPEITEPEEEREPLDWSQNPSLQYGTVKVDWTEEEGKADLKLDFFFENLKEEPAAGDTFSFVVPKTWFHLEDTKENETIKIHAGLLKDMEKEEVRTEKGIIAEYTVQNQKVEVTLLEAVQECEDITSLFGRISMSVSLEEKSLTQEEQKVEWEIRTYEDGRPQKLEVILPKSDSREETEDDSQDTEETTEETTDETTDETPDGDTDKTEEEDALEETPEEEPELPVNMLFSAARAGDFIEIVEKNAPGITQDIFWIDNNDAGGKRPAKDSEDFLNKLCDLAVFTAKYSYQNANEETVTGTISMTLSDLGISKEELSLDDVGGSGHYVFNIPSNKLPSKVNIIDAEDNIYNNVPLTWSQSPTLADKNGNTQNFSNYMVTDVNPETVNSWPGAKGHLGWYFTEDMTYTADCEIREGNDTSDKEKIAKKLAELYHFYWKTGVMSGGTAEFNSGNASLESLDNYLYDDNNPYHFEIKHLPKYNLDGSEIEYYIDRPSDVPDHDKVNDLWDGDDANDYLQETIENNKVSNHGTNTEHVYSGGTLILTKTGLRNYNATKEWKDAAGNKAERPAVQFELWRVSTHELDKDVDFSKLYQTATPVKDENEAKIATDSFGKGSEDSLSISFDECFNKEDGKDYLPKYDSEGYPYVYFVREKMTGDNADKYKVYYGKLNEDGTEFEDTMYLEKKFDRDPQDNSVYDGGTVTNVLDDSVTVKAEKIWNAAVFQSQLSDVEVELTLYKHVKGKNQGDEDDWEPTDEKVILNGFIEEIMSKETSASMPKYDLKGNELEYRWVETAVRQGNSEENLLKKDGSFTLSQNGASVDYTSESEITKEDGVFKTTITNQLEDKRKYRLDKKWDPNIPEEERTAIELLMYRFDYKQNQEAMETEDKTPYQLDGKIDEEKTPLYIGGELVGYVQETEPWHAEFTDLVRYDEGGHPYEYLFLEKRDEDHNWDVDYKEEIDEDGVTHAIITNSLHDPEGEDDEQMIYLRKHWLDDGDVEHREPVYFTVYVKNDEEWTPLDDDYKDIKITEEDGWWKKVQIPDEVKKDDILVLETKVGDTKLTHKQDEMDAIYQVERGDPSAESPYILYQASHHHYVASYSMVSVEDIKFYTVTNNRLGKVDIDVTKKWVDGNNPEKRQELIDKLEEQKWNLGLKLVCSQNDAINYENGTIKLFFDELDVDAIQKITVEDGTDKTYQFYGLPKYDEYGVMVQYHVEEVAYKMEEGKYVTSPLSALNLKDNEYVSSVHLDQYTVVDELDTNDKQEYTVTNQLSGSKQIMFGKEWIDEYRYEMDQRPDIYLEIYKKEHVWNEKTEEFEEQVEFLYLDRDWTFYEDADYFLCKLGELPKYDAFGYEIIYYARERVNVDKSKFDYTDVYYKYYEGEGDPIDQKVSVEDFTEIGDESGWKDGATHGSDEIWPSPNDSEIHLLKESGIFVNELKADVKINGKKIWANVPAGFKKVDLPQIKFSLYQFVKGDTPPTDEGIDNAFKDKKPVASIEIRDWQDCLSNGGYCFNMEYEGENTNSIVDGEIQVSGPGEDPNEWNKLPKYNEDGQLYEYVLREKIIGTNTDMNLDDLLGNNLIFKQPDFNNFAVTNAYEPQLGIIHLRKWLDTSAYKGPDKENPKNPTVSFILTRTYKGNNGADKEDGAFSITKNIPWNEFKDGKGEITFDGLEIYAPNGNRYTYTITENDTFFEGGYVISSGNGKLDADATYTMVKSVGGLYPIHKETEAGGKLAKIVSDMKEQKPFLPTLEKTAFLALPGVKDVKASEIKRAADETENPDESDSTDVAETWATFKDTYTVEKAPLTFTKIWDDYNNVGGVRPDTISFDVFRSADAQAGQGNQIGAQKVCTLTLTGGPEAEDVKSEFEMVDGIPQPGIYFDVYHDKWDVRIQDLSIYAPNGMPWKYSIKEDKTQVKEPYSALIGTLNFTYDKATNKFVQAETGDFTNTMMTSRRVWKNFTKAEGGKTDIKNTTGYAVRIYVDLYVAEAEAGENNTYDPTKFYTPESIKSWQLAKDSPYFKDGINISKDAYNTFAQENFFTYEDGADMNTLSKNGWSLSGLPKAIMKGGKTVYLQYVIMETKLELLEGSYPNYIPVYTETFVPQFKYCQDSNQHNRVGYWLETSAKLSGSDTTYADDAHILFKPVFDSEEKLNKYNDGDTSVLYPYDRGNKTYRPYVPIEKDDMYKDVFEITLVNLAEFTNAEFEKNWVNDSENIYGTREPNNPDGWKLDYQVQRQGKDGDTVIVDWEDYGKKRTISGKDTIANGKSNKITDLPKQALVKVGDDYHIVTYEYRTRECQPDGTVITGNPADETTTPPTLADNTYNSGYDVDYDSEFDEDNNIYSDSATNTLRTIDVYAKKNWTKEELNPSITTVTFELQYQKTDNTWTSFKTPAKVVLNGKTDTTENPSPNTKYYFEYEAWKAKWTGVPEVMPGSNTNDDGETIYRVVEVAPNSYETTSDTKGKGTEDDPYVLASLQNGGAENANGEGSAITYTNELTKLTVQKTVSIPNGAALCDKNEEFTFEISGAGSYKIPDGTYWYERGPIHDSSGGSVISPPPEQLSFVVKDGIGSFSLKRDEKAVIYGLEKGKSYKVTETGDGYSVSYEIDSGVATEGNSAEIEIPDTVQDFDPVTAIPPTVEFINSKYGKITIEKKDQNGIPVNAGDVTFQLLYKAKDSTAEYKVVNKTVCKNTAITNNQGKVSTNNNGKVIFDKLLLEYDYRIVEVEAKGMNLLIQPIDLTLPYKSDKDTDVSSGDAYYTIEGNDGKEYYYPEVTISIENNEAFIMPSTDGNGFFWPGMFGMGIAVAAGGVFICMEERKRRKSKER